MEIGYTSLPQVFFEESDKLKIIEEVILQTPVFLNSYEKKSDKEKREFKYACLEVISKIKRNVILDENLKEEIDSEEIILFYLNYREYMRNLNAIDFDDLLLEVYKLFVTFPNIAALYRRTFEYICIDEAQDMNKAQYLLVKALTSNENTNIMLVGDPKQSIYGFIGSDSKYMTKDFVIDYKPEIFELKENFRSSKKVLGFANKIIPNSSNLDNASIEGIYEEHEFNTQYEEAQFVVNKIQELIKIQIHSDIEDTITYEKITILARNRYVLHDTELLLKEYEIPFNYKKNGRGLEFESLTGTIFDLALRIKINQKDFLHLDELKQIFNISNCTSLSELHGIVENDFYKVLLNSILEIKEDGSNFRKIIDILKSVIEKTESIDVEEKEPSYSDILMIEEAWNKYAASSKSKSLATFHNTLSLGQSIINKDQVGVTLSTIHNMKGQENDIVFLIGMDDLTFPDYRAVLSGGLEMEQEKNDLYVAVTRAKRFLYITYPLSRQMPWGAIRTRTRSRLLPNKD